jgi:hypothetical protein
MIADEGAGCPPLKAPVPPDADLSVLRVHESSLHQRWRRPKLATLRASQRAFRIGPGSALDSSRSENRRATRSGSRLISNARSNSPRAASALRPASFPARRDARDRRNARVRGPSRRGRTGCRSKHNTACLALNPRCRSGVTGVSWRWGSRWGSRRSWRSRPRNTSTSQRCLTLSIARGEKWIGAPFCSRGLRSAWTCGCAGRSWPPCWWIAKARRLECLQGITTEAWAGFGQRLSHY